LGSITSENFYQAKKHDFNLLIKCQVKVSVFNKKKCSQDGRFFYLHHIFLDTGFWVVSQNSIPDWKEFSYLCEQKTWTIWPQNNFKILLLKNPNSPLKQEFCNTLPETRLDLMQSFVEWIDKLKFQFGDCKSMGTTNKHA